MNIYFYDTSLGKIGIAEHDGSITNLYFGNNPFPQHATEQETPLLAEASRQLGRYLVGELKEFTLPLCPKGTLFMQQVWKVLRGIPYGKTITYKQVATKVGNDKAIRAVGMANNRNPIPVFIPCHRVIGSNGALVGYRGGLAVKENLLSMEGIHG